MVDQRARGGKVAVRRTDARVASDSDSLRQPLFQRSRQRLQLCDEIGAERINDFNDRECDAGGDQAVLDCGGGGFIGQKFNQQAFQFHKRVLRIYQTLRAWSNALEQSKIE